MLAHSATNAKAIAQGITVGVVGSPTSKRGDSSESSIERGVHRASFIPLTGYLGCSGKFRCCGEAWFQRACSGTIDASRRWASGLLTDGEIANEQARNISAG